MILFMFAVFDDAVKSFSAPMFFQTKEQASRYFEFLCAGDDTDIGRFPHSHHLYHVGEFDVALGLIDGFDAPKLVLSGSSVSKEDK